MEHLPWIAAHGGWLWVPLVLASFFVGKSVRARWTRKRVRRWAGGYPPPTLSELDNMVAGDIGALRGVLERGKWPPLRGEEADGRRLDPGLAVGDKRLEIRGATRVVTGSRVHLNAAHEITECSASGGDRVVVRGRLVSAIAEGGGYRDDAKVAQAIEPAEEGGFVEIWNDGPPRVVHGGRGWKGLGFGLAALSFVLLWLSGAVANRLSRRAESPQASVAWAVYASATPMNRRRGLHRLVKAYQRMPPTAETARSVAAALLTRDNCEEAVHEMVRRSELDYAVELARDCEDSERDPVVVWALMLSGRVDEAANRAASTMRGTNERLILELQLYTHQWGEAEETAARIDGYSRFPPMCGTDMKRGPTFRLSWGQFCVRRRIEHIGDELPVGSETVVAALKKRKAEDAARRAEAADAKGGTAEKDAKGGEAAKAEAADPKAEGADSKGEASAATPAVASLGAGASDFASALITGGADWHLLNRWGLLLWASREAPMSAGASDIRALRAVLEAGLGPPREGASPPAGLTPWLDALGGAWKIASARDWPPGLVEVARLRTACRRARETGEPPRRGQQRVVGADGIGRFGYSREYSLAAACTGDVEGLVISMKSEPDWMLDEIMAIAPALPKPSAVADALEVPLAPVIERYAKDVKARPQFSLSGAFLVALRLHVAYRDLRAPGRADLWRERALSLYKNLSDPKAAVRLGLLPRRYF